MVNIKQNCNKILQKLTTKQITNPQKQKFYIIYHMLK